MNLDGTLIPEVLGIAIVVYVIVEGLKFGLYEEHPLLNWLPLVSGILGISLAIAYGLMTNGDLPILIVGGAIGGASASGSYDGLKMIIAKVRGGFFE